MFTSSFEVSITAADVDYVGSITIDAALMERTGLEPGEKVQVVSVTSGARLETYVLPGELSSGVIAMNGAAAHLIRAGECVIIMGYTLSEKPVQPRAILVDEQNRFAEWL